jgi:hypothetical protein
MQLLATFSVAFDAGHGEHGHHYIVKVTCEDLTDLGVVADMAALREEFNERSMEAMLPATPSDPAHIAAYVLERLRSRHAGVVEVEVRESEMVSGLARFVKR